MKQSPSDMALEGRLGPSKFSGEGFMGGDQRTPHEVIAADARTLEELGVSLESLAGALNGAYLKAEGAFGETVALSERAEIQHFESKGRLPCPFGGHGVFAKGEAVIAEWKSGRRTRITPLSIHLIKEHGFFQGEGSPFRIDPAVIAEVLGLTGRQSA